MGALARPAIIALAAIAIIVDLYQFPYLPSGGTYEAGCTTCDPTAIRSDSWCRPRLVSQSRWWGRCRGSGGSMLPTAMLAGPALGWAIYRWVNQSLSLKSHRQPALPFLQCTTI